MSKKMLQKEIVCPHKPKTQYMYLHSCVSV